MKDLRSWPRYERFAELIAVNGGTDKVTRVGTVTASDVNRWGRLGLTPSEALELCYLSGMFDALCNIFPDQVADAREEVGRQISGLTIVIARPEEVAAILRR